jgi:hypothetical protein
MSSHAIRDSYPTRTQNLANLIGLMEKVGWIENVR